MKLDRDAFDDVDDGIGASVQHGHSVAGTPYATGDRPSPSRFEGQRSRERPSEVDMFEDDAITISGDDSPQAQELLDAVEWLRHEGYLSGEDRPFQDLLDEAAEA